VVQSRDAVDDLAERALSGALTGDDLERLGELAEEAGALVDAWRYVPAGTGTIPDDATYPGRGAGMVE
jgi:hypothetical protein